MSEQIIIRPATAEDAIELLALYRRVARVPGGLARLEGEVTFDYVEGFLSSVHDRGLAFIAANGDQLVGEIHAYSPGLFCFSHVLADLTIAVDPVTQGMGVGRKLFERLMSVVAEDLPVIERVELIARESNEKALRFYESLGFQREGVLRGRIQNLDGSRESDIPMAWIRNG